MAIAVGFIGLGIMGRPMAANLAAKFPVMGYDLDGSRFNNLEGVSRARSVAEVAGACATVLLSLPSAAIVEEVTIGGKGLVHDLPTGALVLDLSTSLPSVSRRIAARLAEKKIDFADAPVSGGEAGAKSASLAIMVGASAAAWERCRPILAALGKSIVRVGEVGAGGVAKLVNNMIVASTFAVIAEGFALAMKNGIDPASLYESIKDGWAGSKVLDVSAAAMIARDYTPGGTIDMLEKDLGYARTLAAESKVPIPMTALSHEVFVAGQAAGSGRLSQPAILELWRKAAAAGEK